MQPPHRSLVVGALVLALVASSCASSSTNQSLSDPQPDRQDMPDEAETPDVADTPDQPGALEPSDRVEPDNSRQPDSTADAAAVSGCADEGSTLRTDIQPSGNRSFAGTIDLATAPTEVTLGAEPVWVLPGDVPGSWYVVLVDDSAVMVDPDGTVTPAVAPPAGEPPELVRGQGSLRVESAYNSHSLFGDPLPDSRVVFAGPIAVALVGPTDRYQHGIAGDVIEASAVEVFDRCAQTRIRIEIEAPSVIEGISPMLADIDGDGAADVIVTTSNGTDGARLEAYRTDGTLLGKSEPIGLGNRWRNQLGVAPTGPGGVPELIDVRVPHINGVVEFIQLQGDQLVIAASATGFTSHVIRSRNLDMGILADATSDGRPEVIIYTQDRSQLAALARTDTGVEVVTTVDLRGRGVTNIAVQDLESGASLAVGTSTGTLHIWAS